MDVIVAGVAVVAFIAVIVVFTGTLTDRRRHEPMRVAADPYDQGWMTVAEVARELDISESAVMDLVDRREVPFFVVPGARRPSPDAYRFRRDEIEEWTIG